MNDRPGTIDDWIKCIGGTRALARWKAPSARRVHRACPSSTPPKQTVEQLAFAHTYIATASVLLRHSRSAAAFCGKKEVLGALKDRYYEHYFNFASGRPGVSVVRLFPKGVDSAALRSHQRKQGVIGIEVSNPRTIPFEGASIDMAELDLGFVLFRQSGIYTAIVHWNESNRFCWTVTSDPLLALVLRDEWGAQLGSYLSKPDPRRAEVLGFARSFGVHVPARSALK